jgi:hypothetical protein
MNPMTAFSGLSLGKPWLKNPCRDPAGADFAHDPWLRIYP